MKLPFYLFCLTASGIVGISPASTAHGISVNHISAVDTHDNNHHDEHYRYPGNYFGMPYGIYGVSYYDSDYCYTPTPVQLAVAQKQVELYLSAVKKHREHQAKHRYISVETLRPTKKQLEDYTKKRSEGKFATAPAGSGSSSGSADDSKLRCLMVYDTQTKQFIGSGCYLVSDEPAVGNVSVFQTVSAEFVGQNSL
jgi:hypothetical protein